MTDLKELFSRSDFVSAHLPLNRDTRGVLDYELFSAMKPTAYFINTGRGPVHNEADLIRALREGKLAGAGLDVMELEPTRPDNPLHTMDNVVLTPHSASVSDWANVERRRRVGQDIAAVLQGRMPRAVVLIDDFAVPDDPGYGFDDYGPDAALTVTYLERSQLPRASRLFFPTVPSKEETGHRRGAAVLTADAELGEVVARTPLLRPWPLALG